MGRKPGPKPAGGQEDELARLRLRCAELEARSERCEEALRESERRFHALFDGAGDAIFILDPDGGFLDVNRAACEPLGYSREELLRMTLADIETPENAALAAKRAQELFRRKRLVFETALIRRDGKILPVELSCRPIQFAGKAAILAVAHDLAERKRAEAALRDSREYLEKIIDCVADPIFVKDRRHRYVLVNEAECALHGCPREELLGKSDPDFYPKEMYEVFWRQDDAVMRTGEPNVNEELISDAQGRLRTIVTKKMLHTDKEGGKFIVGVIRDITQLKEAEEAVRRELQFFQRGPVIAFRWKGGPHRPMEYMSPNVRQLGYEPEDFLSGRVVYLDLMDAGDREQNREPFNAARDQGQNSCEHEYRIRTADGRERWMHELVLINRDAEGKVVHYDAYALDITERKRAEQALQLTQFAVEHSADAAFWMGPDARLLYVNETAWRTLGYTREELLTMTVHDIDPNFPREVWANHWREVKTRGSFPLESHHRRKDGTVFPVEVRVNYMEFGGKEYNCAFARDISERKRAEEERRRLETQMQHAQKLESLGVLAGGIAHDFNNLLTSILGHADLATSEMSPVAPARESLEEIGKAARRAAELCRQMLAYSGRGRFVVQTLDLGELVGEMAHMLEVSISKKAVLRYKFADGVPPIEADPTQIRQIVMNLVINASEAIGEKSGVIALSTGVMECSNAYLDETWLKEELPPGLYVYMEVADTGCGMDKDTVSRIFDPFFTTKFTGRGLGLAAVLGIVRGHRGAIKVYSEPGKGTTFKVLLPASTRPAQPLEDRPETVASWRGSGTVLLVDDEETVRALGKRMLERLGFVALTACDGREAVEVYRRHADEIVCVVLDLTMPHMDGEAAFRELKALRNDVRVILSSGYTEQEVTERFLGKGVRGFVQKPYQLAALATRLRACLEE